MRQSILAAIISIMLWILMGCKSSPIVDKRVTSYSTHGIRYHVAVVRGRLVTNWNEGDLSVAQYALESSTLGSKRDVYVAYYEASTTGPLPGRAILVLEPVWSNYWQALGCDAGRCILSQTTGTVASVEESIRAGRFLPEPRSWLPEKKAVENALTAMNFTGTDLEEINVSAGRYAFGWRVDLESKPDERGEVPLGAYWRVVVADDGRIMQILRGF